MISLLRALRYRWQVSRLHHQLGIVKYDRLPFFAQATDLVRVGSNQLSPDASAAWLEMQKVAAADGIELRLFCGYRGPQEQADIIRHFRQTKTLEEALHIAAAPGHSEHHTGRALDIGTTDCFPPTLEFEHTHAYDWLTQHAKDFGFTLSYARDNPHGITFEPWHWRYTR